MKLKSILLPAIIATVSALFLSAFQKKPVFDLKSSIGRGREPYVTYCVSCHMDQGEGINGVYPPLAKSNYLMADKKRSIQQVLYGASGEMKVNGTVYNAEMTGFDLSDQDAADILNYIRNSFGNKGDAVTPEQVKALRKK